MVVGYWTTHSRAHIFTRPFVMQYQERRLTDPKWLFEEMRLDFWFCQEYEQIDIESMIPEPGSQSSEDNNIITLLSVIL